MESIMNNTNKTWSLKDDGSLHIICSEFGTHCE